MKFGRFAGVIALVLLAACSQGAKTTTQSTPAPAETNAAGFPLYQDSTVLAGRVWRETVSASLAKNAPGVFGQGGGTYAGHETIAQSSATMEELKSWLRDVEKTPPQGYTLAPYAAQAGDARSRAQALGIDFSAFNRNIDGKRHDVVVIALDPETIDSKAGPMLNLIGKYKMLPQGLRDPIDAQAKKQTGFSISEALSTDTPIGAALDAFDRLRSSGQRGIVVLDAAKQ
jgi:hypothetical protein